MKISLNWIKDYVDLSGIETDEIVKRFNLSTAEIEEVEYMGAKTHGVVFGKILEVKPHPTNAHWHILKVDIGTKTLQIVCGAPNVREGMVTCVATDGGCVNGFKISVAKRGDIDSEGMCCSSAELGIGSDNDGIMDLVGDYPIGTDIKEYWPVDDIILEIDNKTLTNRPDLWGHYGMAREFAVIFDRPLKKIDVADLSRYNALKKISIENKSKNCYRYSAISAENITVKKSPDFMKIRLTYCGMRDINLLADLTNYVMMDVGLPMHAFDNNVVKGIKVVDSHEGTKMLTLEGEEHTLPENAVTICDQGGEPVAIAGVKGGLKSGISDSTTSVLFEAAVFNSTAIRKTSRKIGLVTDASIRYEKSLDPEKTTLALSRMIKLLCDIDSGAKVTSALSDSYDYHYPKLSIEISPKFISNIVGENLEEERVVKILTGLGFDVKTSKNGLVVGVPSWRATKDVSIKEDLVEEVARMFGYDNIEPKPLKFEAVPVALKRDVLLEYESKKYLAEKYGATEVHSYIWNYKDFCEKHKIEHPSYIKLMDSSNSGQDSIRSKLAPTMLKFFEENRNSLDDIRIFEIGRVVTGLDEQKLAIEKKHLAVLLASQTDSEEKLFNEAKKIVVDLAKTVVGLDVNLKRGETSSYYHPVNSARVVSRTDDFGEMGILHPTVKKSIDKRFNVCLIELDFGKLAAAPVYYKKPKMLSKYQQVNMDFNFLVDKKLSYGEFESTLSKYRNKISNGFELVDIYEDDSLGDRKSITVRFELGSFDHTLSGEEIEKFRGELIAHASKNNIILR
ncbi:MAG: phenylalanine--tRNA ligase subunit beta [Clostridia bacterium]|nr:phenylalanine--tRNA ligase subunit beta [Clostridia bacterium]